MTQYELSRDWFDWCFENPELITPTHTAMYFFIIEHWNRLGQKEKFGLPMEMTKDAIGIKNYRTFSKVFRDITEWGFIKVVQKSKNQYSANVIALVKNTKAHTKALAKASLKHVQKQVHGIVGINKLYNQELYNHLTCEQISTLELMVEKFIDANEKGETGGGEPIETPHMVYPQFGKDITYTSEQAGELETELQNNYSQHVSLVNTAYEDFKVQITTDDVTQLIPTFIRHLSDVSKYPITLREAKTFFGYWFKSKVKEHVNKQQSGTGGNRRRQNGGISDEFRAQLRADLQAGIGEAITKEA